MTRWLLCGNWDFEDFLLWDFLLGRCCCLSFSFQKNSKGRGKGLYANIFFVSVLCFLGELPRGALLVYCSDAHMHSTETKTKTSTNSKKRSWNLPDQYPTCEFCTLSGQWMIREKALLVCLDQGGVGATGLFDKKDFDTVCKNVIPLPKAFARLQAPPTPISGIVNVP